MKFARHLNYIGTQGIIPWFSGEIITCSGVIANADKLHHYQHCFNTLSGINEQKTRPQTFVCTEFSIFTLLFNTSETKIFIAAIRISCTLLQVLSM